jgi:hypothetical protein
LYIFERLISVDETTADSTKYTYEYSGYYVVKDETNGAKYYAINISNDLVSARNADGTVNTIDASKATLQQTKTITNAKLAFTSGVKQDTTTSTYYVLATYCPGSDTSVAGKTDHYKDLKIRINLASDYATNWTYISQTDNNVPTFYLNTILKSGATSPQLISSVEIDSSVLKDAYKSFDYNLNVTAKSVQVIYNSDGSTVNVTESGDGASVNAVNTEWKDSTAKLTKNNGVTTDTPTVDQVAITWAKKS